MRAEVVRRFNLIDGMVLVAATALGLWAGRLTIDMHSRVFLAGTTEADSAVNTARFVVLAWTVAVVALRFRAPRPRRRRLWRQPGLAACSAVLLNGIFSVGLLLIELLLQLRNGPPVKTVLEIDIDVHNLTAALASPCYVAPPMLVVWIILAMGGRWRPEASWIDRLGRSLGLLWVALAVFIQVRDGLN